MANKATTNCRLLNMLQEDHPRYYWWRRFVIGLHYTVLNHASNLLDELDLNPNALTLDRFTSFVVNNGFIASSPNSTTPTAVSNVRDDQSLGTHLPFRQNMNRASIEDNFTSSAAFGSNDDNGLVEDSTGERPVPSSSSTTIPDVLQEDSERSAFQSSSNVESPTTDIFFADSETDLPRRRMFRAKTKKTLFPGKKIASKSQSTLKGSSHPSSTPNQVQSSGQPKPNTKLKEESKKRWICSNCQKADFGSKYTRDRHFRTCSEVTPTKFKCSVKDCGASYNWRHELKNHVVEQHYYRSNGFKCTYCALVFQLRIQRIHHIRKDHPSSYQKKFGEAKSDSSSDD